MKTPLARFEFTGRAFGARPLIGDRRRFERLAGMFLVTFLPALFWVCALAAVAPALGRTPTLSALALTGTAIALFLASVCAPIVLRTR